MGGPLFEDAFARQARKQAPLQITGLKVTPIALPDPPILAASGCHGLNLPIRNGVDLDGDKLARAHEVCRKCGMRGRDDATTMRRVEPGRKRTLF